MTEFNPGGAASLNQAVKLRYEANADTNAFTDAEKSKLAGIQPGGAVSQAFEIGGRWYCNTDNRWVGFPTSFGTNSENFSQGAGTGASPSLSWDAFGPFMPAGRTLTGLNIIARTTHPEVTGMNLRLYYVTGPFDGTWDSAANTTRTLVHGADSLGLSRDSWSRHTADYTPFTCPADGMLLMFVQPLGAITAVRYIISTVQLVYTD